MALMAEEPIHDRLANAAMENGKLKERNRILSILIRYKDAGWLDPSTAVLLAEDICEEK